MGDTRRAQTVGRTHGKLEFIHGHGQKARDALVAAIPVGRIGEPEDIWQAVRFAVECEYFSGRCLDVDGGLVMT